MENNEFYDWLKVYNTLLENQRRWYAAGKANELGRGGISQVMAITGLSRNTIKKGMQELKNNEVLDRDNSIRKPGGGRKSKAKADQKLTSDLESIINDTIAGDPMSNLKWTCKSTRNISDELNKLGHQVTHETVRTILKAQGYSLQTNKKMLSGKDHPDRDSQFKYINQTVNRFFRNNNPVISVDTKKKELVGNFGNKGHQWKKKGEELLRCWITIISR